MDFVNPSTGDYIACTYDKEWFIGLVEEVCVEEGYFKVKFMHPKGPRRPENCFYWPLTENICFIPENDILCRYQLQYHHQEVDENTS